MKELIFNFNLYNIRKKLIFTYILNILDIIFTILLINTGFIIELNPIMKKVITNYNYSFLVKGILPALLIIYIYLRIKKASLIQLKKSNYLINGVLLLYLVINVMHIICIIWYIYCKMLLYYV